MSPSKAITKKGLTSSSILKLQIKEETEKRKLMTQFISDHLVDGVDFGKIHIVSRAKCPDYYNCKNSNHFSKNTLFKSGSEKFMSLLHLRATFRKDIDTWGMFGSTNGTICYICELTGPNGLVVGEGRGAATLQEEQTANKVVKLAAKRAQMDAILRTGGLSDYFTQDLDDESQRTEKTVTAQGSRIVYITEKQLNFLKILLNQKGKTEKEILEYYKIDSMEKIPIDKASKMIERLQTLSVTANVTPPKKEEPVGGSGGSSHAPAGGVLAIAPADKPTIKDELIGKKEEKKEEKVPAANYEIAWVKARFSQFVDAKIMSLADRESIDFMTHDEYLDLKGKFNNHYEPKTN